MIRVFGLMPIAADAGQLVSYRFARLEQFDDPRWLWGLVGAAAAASITFVVWQYRREAPGLSFIRASLLAALRITALLALILFYLSPIKRTDVEVTTDSRVVLLADASQSMAIADAIANDDAKLTRASSVAFTLSETPLLEQLNGKHDVAVASFEEQFQRLAQWKRTATPLGDAKEAGVEAGVEGEAVDRSDVNWGERLAPLGAETRMGDALSQLLSDRSGGPLAGIVVFSDGGQNSGVDPLSLAEVARQRRVPIFTVGIGSTQPRRNIRVQEVVAPSRAYPNDKTKVRAIIHAEGFRNRSASVQLYTRFLQGDSATPASLVDSATAEFDGESDVSTVDFTIEPAEIGRVELEVRVQAPPDDQHDGDNVAAAEIEIVETSTRVLLIASGATREYRFLRDQLRRDAHSTVDVWLQMAPPGISQDADEILDHFPLTKQELYEYDCIVAFDPDWTMIDAQQVEMLESWVADEAGGMIVVAGPVHTAAWVQSPEYAKVRALYPVEFQRRLTLLDDGLYGSPTPWPILFTRAGLEAQFLALGDDRSAVSAELGTGSSEQNVWDRFKGVFGCYAVKGPKPAAQVYGRYSDPDAGLSLERPVYMAEQFYGSGRVFYLGSGEMWRLRALDPGYFEVLYTQLIRHVTQGRLLRGSSRGMLLVERDHYRVGDEVVVRAQLTTAAQEPYLANNVTLRATGPDGTGQNVVLAGDDNRAGNFVGQFTVLSEGAYRLELSVPDALDEQLVRRIQATVPDLEYARTRRNVELLTALAKQTGGRYYENPAQAALGAENVRAVGELIDSQAETKIIEGKPDPAFALRLHQLLLAVICGALCSEWLLRRLMRLA